MKRSIALSIIGLFIYAILGTASLQFGAVGGPITMLTILNRVKPVVQLLRLAKQASDNATKSVDASFKTLSGYLSAKQLNNEAISSMEASLIDMRSRADTLRYILKETENNAAELFSVLKARAKENQTKTFKKAMLKDIKAKETAFGQHLKTARVVLARIDDSVQKYDDILGYVQVNRVLTHFDPSYIALVNQVIQEGGALSSEIQRAIDQGLSIVNTVQQEAEQGSQQEGQILKQ